jgi:hypothetical protein
MGDVIGGTVIQRSFVGRVASNVIHIASVPVAELGTRSEIPEELLAEVLGIPQTTILDDSNYRRVIEMLRRFPPDYFFPYWHPRTDRYFHRLYDALQPDSAPKELFADFLATAGSNTPFASVLTPWPLLIQAEFPEKIELNPEVLAAALQCIASRAMRSRESEQFIQEVFTYDIPLGQSPTVKADSLLQLLESSRKFCVAPLALGGVQAVAQLTQGNYVAALLTTGTAGVMTLVLIGTVSVGALIVQKVAQARARGNPGHDGQGGDLSARSTRTPRKRGAG